MSLDWDLSKIKDRENTCFSGEADKDGRRHMHPITHALIWTCVGIDMGEITESNYQEFFLRTLMWEGAIGTMLKDGESGADRPLTLEDIRAHIGLKVNVCTTNRRQFILKLGKALQSAAMEKLRQQLGDIPFALTEPERMNVPDKIVEYGYAVLRSMDAMATDLEKLDNPDSDMVLAIREDLRELLSEWEL